MSLKATVWAWKQKVPPASKLVLLRLADQANDAGECWPSYDSISTPTGLSRSTVAKALKDMRDVGLLSWRQRSNQGGQTSNVYLLYLANTAPSGNRTPQSDSETHPVRETDPPRPAVGHESIKESTSESKKRGEGKDKQKHDTDPVDANYFFLHHSDKIYPDKTASLRARSRKVIDALILEHGAEHVEGVIIALWKAQGHERAYVSRIAEACKTGVMV